MGKHIKQIAFILCLLICLGITGCQKEEEIEETRPEINAMDSTITGDTYTASFYTNDGEKFMEAKGSNIQLFPLSYEKSSSGYSSSGDYNISSWTEYSSMLQVNIDGKEINGCGSTIIFVQDSLTPDAEFSSENDVNSKNLINTYCNNIDKKYILILQSQMGDPIAIYSGDVIYGDIITNLPKMTRIMIDGKTIYIHRANYQVVEKATLGC